MTPSTQDQIELTALLNLIPYLDIDFNFESNTSLADIVEMYKDSLSQNNTFQVLKTAIEQNPEYGAIQLVDQSSTNQTAAWTDDLIQACTFVDSSGNYYVAFRGTGDGRWADNGNGMTAQSTEMQQAASAYFDKMAEKYFIEASESGAHIYVTGHSKGGNEAQYVYMASEYEYLIDRCYSFDGQGFSGSAIDGFVSHYGESYDDKLSNMYSICGENDYVHDLGFVIIPEDNTYFVYTTDSGNPFVSYHALENMISNDEYTYTGLSWGAEQGDVGQLAKQLSVAMMQLDDEDLNGAAIALMSFIDPYSNDDILGNIEIKWTDYVDLAAHGLPAIIETLFLTEEGRTVLGELIAAAGGYLYEEYGVGGVVVGFAVGSLLLAKIVVPIVASVIVIANILDFAIDTVDKLVEFSKKVRDCLSQMKAATIAAVNRFIAAVRSLSAGGRYAAANPQIKVDTYKLSNYAARIQDVNRRIRNLDYRLDSLYWKVGLLDLWNLMQADLLTSYSWRLLRCSSYLLDTARDFENAETTLIRNL